NTDVPVASGPARRGGGAGRGRRGGAAGNGGRRGGAGHLFAQRLDLDPEALHLEPELGDLSLELLDVGPAAPPGTAAAARSRAESEAEDHHRHHHETPHHPMMAHEVLPRSIPSTSPSSVTAATGSSTLIVVMPMARADLRLVPRSSRNTDSVGA